MRQFDFLGKTKIFLPISLVLILISFIVLIPGIRGLRMGIDFTGGMEFTILFTEAVDTAKIRSALGDIYAGGVDLTKSVIQDTEGNKKIITMQLDDSDTADQIVAMLQRDFPVEDQGISRRLIGKQVSRELAEKGWQAVLLALVAILVYISWRFRLRYAIGAVAAILHDVIIALGLFAIFQVEVNLATIAAFLTIVGYSLNDTIVIYDRIRENFKLERRKTVFEVINHSVNQSLSRTLNTSTTTFIPVIILFLFGGSVLRGFSLALLIGVIVGTYSSMYIANPILYAWTMKAGGAKKAK
ncbi:protein translocase subunit SecF [Candidatus Bipolaricaulota bacterium]|nr:protein translocase subunit SecF [Candidatus Bipolaricaulota bacterium]MCK5585541.1 protein translocase subunit SecF [Candidatus Bipolaricaulota bacterium]